MNDRVDRFRNRQAVIDAKRPLTLLPPSDLAGALTQHPVNDEYVNALLAVNAIPVVDDVSAQKVSDLLREMKGILDKERLGKLVSDSKRDMITSIAGPFGIGKFVSAYDKTGGDVSTILNARKDVYATKAAKDAYDDRGEYNSDEYHNKHPGYKAEGDTDVYTGEKFQPKDIDPSFNPSIEHFIPAVEIHNDRGRVLAGLDGADLANEATNLGLVNLLINKSKTDDSATKFIKRHTNPKVVEIRTKKLEELKALETPSEHDLRNIKRLELLNSVDPQKVLEKDVRAREANEKKISDTYYGSRKFKTDTFKAGGGSGLKMGFQQAFGMMLVEFLAAVFDEVTDWYKNGKGENAIATELKKRLVRTAKRVGSKWKDVLHGFKDGFIAGFLSSIVTTLINTFLTTGKRLVRMLREGLMSLLKAIKTLILPPEGMTFKQALDASSKIAVGGTIILGGIVLEEIIEKQFTMAPLLLPLAHIAVPIIVGSITALVTTFAIYLMDKADIFGVNAIAQNEQIGKELTNRIDASVGRLELLLA
ncbi:lactate permease [Pseudomonas sp. F01002]|uniref:lactate permease n=1 Tax=Pseudomonas sp. F01002 TaxID=2555724 RepID=UPI001069A3C5|nr:lactate permease [Pseudomonas sp. F01002]TFB39015.1 lactate permease [Pseudomonas sp. F01002]